MDKSPKAIRCQSSMAALRRHIGSSGSPPVRLFLAENARRSLWLRDRGEHISFSLILIQLSDQIQWATRSWFLTKHLAILTCASMCIKLNKCLGSASCAPRRERDMNLKAQTKFPTMACQCYLHSNFTVNVCTVLYSCDESVHLGSEHSVGAQGTRRVPSPRMDPLQRSMAFQLTGRSATHTFQRNTRLGFERRIDDCLLRPRKTFFMLGSCPEV